MSNKTVKNVGIILGCSIAAKILSYIWEATLAAFLGASDQADAFYMTTSIFGILYPILDLGIWKVFLPTYKTKLVENNEKKAEEVANIAVTLFLTLSVALVLFLIVCARPLVAIMAPGFAPDKRAMTIEYLRISAPTYLLMATTSVVGAMLQSREKFLGSQIREIGTHVSKIIYIFITYRFFGIYAAVTAMIIGSIFRLLIQLPFINWKWKFKLNFNFKGPDIVPMIKGLPSVAITAAIAHINGLIDKMVASGSATGSVACLNYGHKLMNVFSGMISTAIATAVYPSIIQHIAKKEDDKLRTLLRNVLCALMFFIIPISFFCFLFSTELVTVAFQRGAFDASATSLTAEVFVGYCLGMLFLGVSTVITNVFYGYGDTKITMYISIVEIALNIVFDLLFVKFWGVAGLAFATSISAIICLAIRMIYMKKYIRIGYKSTAIEGIKIIVLSVVACIVPYLIIDKLLHLNVYISLFIGAAVSVGIYLVLAYVLHIKTLDFVRTLIGNRFGRKKKV
jgi:murein biosynthesis integral membrane protein MurJ